MTRGRTLDNDDRYILIINYAQTAFWTLVAGLIIGCMLGFIGGRAFQDYKTRQIAPEAYKCIDRSR